MSDLCGARACRRFAAFVKKVLRRRAGSFLTNVSKGKVRSAWHPAVPSPSRSGRVRWRVLRRWSVWAVISRHARARERERKRQTSTTPSFSPVHSPLNPKHEREIESPAPVSRMHSDVTWENFAALSGKSTRPFSLKNSPVSTLVGAVVSALKKSTSVRLAHKRAPAMPRPRTTQIERTRTISEKGTTKRSSGPSSDVHAGKGSSRSPYDFITAAPEPGASSFKHATPARLTAG